MTGSVECVSGKGLVWPSTESGGWERLRLSRLASMVERARSFSQDVAIRGDVWQGVAECLLSAFDQLDPYSLDGAFGHPTIPIWAGLSSEVDMGRALLQVAGRRDLQPFHTVLPAEVVDERSVYLPAFDAAIGPGGGPVAVWSRPGIVRLTWLDGWSVTLPETPTDFSTDRAYSNIRLKNATRAVRKQPVGHAPRS